MFLFNKSKTKDEPKSAAPVSPAPVQPVKPASAEDFFADLDRKAKPNPVEQPVKTDVDVPDVVGLREEPLPEAESSMNDVEADELAAENLTDKTLGDDGNYHGNMNDAYIAPEAPKEEKAFDPSNAVTADDFFSNMGRKSAPKPAAEPVVLREEPLPEVGSSMNGLDVSALATDGLRDKSYENDELYHGSMNDIPDEEAINTDSLATKHLKADADDSGNIYSDDDYDIDESSIVVEEINE